MVVGLGHLDLYTSSLMSCLASFGLSLLQNCIEHIRLRLVYLDQTLRICSGPYLLE